MAFRSIRRRLGNLCGYSQCRCRWPPTEASSPGDFCVELRTFLDEVLDDRWLVADYGTVQCGHAVESDVAHAEVQEIFDVVGVAEEGASGLPVMG
jgi:hypothetical protein